MQLPKLMLLSLMILMGSVHAQEQPNIVFVFFMVYVGNDLFGIKWRNWKMMFKEVERGTDEKRTFDFPRFFNLYSDPKEEYPLTKATAGHFWVRWPMGVILTEHGESLQREPPIKAGTPDPYSPSRGD